MEIAVRIGLPFVISAKNAKKKHFSIPTGFQKKDGTIGIFDTKGGQTAVSKDTKNKAEALQKRLSMLNNLAEGRINYVGGIVIAANGTWYYNDNEEYAYQPGSTDGWKLMQDMFDVLMDGDSLNTAILHSISPSDRFTRFLPLYSIQAACGYFDEYEEPETEGWVDVSSLPFTPNREMFMVHAKGNSMLPKLRMETCACLNVIMEVRGKEKSYSRK